MAGGNLIERAARGDRAALERLWLAERRRVAAVLLAHRPREEDLEDLLQEVASILVERIGELRDPSRFSSWLRTIAINAARTSGRRAKILRDRRRSLGDTPDPLARESSPLTQLEQKENLRQVLHWIQGMSPDVAEPLLMRSVWGLSQRQIAEWLGLPETTIETRIAKARRALREQIEASDRLRRAE